MKTRLMLAGVAAANLVTFTAQAQVPPGQPIPRSDPNGVYCREYTQPVMVGGRQVSSYGQACQQPDGAWKIISNDQGERAQASQAPVEYLDEPQYISPPQYVAPPVAYYYPPPTYYYPAYPAYYPAPYYYGSGFSFSYSQSWGGHRGRDWHGWHGGYRH